MLNWVNPGFTSGKERVQGRRRAVKRGFKVWRKRRYIFTILWCEVAAAASAPVITWTKPCPCDTLSAGVILGLGPLLQSVRCLVIWQVWPRPGFLPCPGSWGGGRGRRLRGCGWTRCKRPGPRWTGPARWWSCFGSATAGRRRPDGPGGSGGKTGR